MENLAESSKHREDSFYIHRALNHPLRKRILELLSEKGSMSFTEFKKTLDVRVGTLYYHFDALSRLISQDEQKRYILTPLGQRAYEVSRSEESVAPSRPLLPKPRSAAGVYFRNLFLPSGFFSYIYARPRVGIPLAFLVIALGALVSFQAKLDPLLFFFDRAIQGREILIPIELVLSWFGVFLISDLLARALFQRKGDHLLLLIGTSFAFAPVLLFPLLRYLDLSLGLRSPFTRDPTAVRTLLVALQTWAIVILTYAVSLSKGLRIDKATIVSLIVAYSNILLLFVLGRISSL